MSTITIEQQAAIAAKLDGMNLPKGLGDEHAACSIATINLALSGRLTDEIPDCMSPVIGRWIITAQDAMPDAMRNSPRWKAALPLAAGTGREHEKERMVIILDWMWSVVLPALQPLADERGFGLQWRHMTTERTAEAARAALWAATRAAEDAAARSAARSAARAAEAAEAMAAGAAVEAMAALRAATWAAEAWNRFDPCALLERLIAVGEQA
jgi:hypothetical protein